MFKTIYKFICCLCGSRSSAILRKVHTLRGFENKLQMKIFTRKEMRTLFDGCIIDSSLHHVPFNHSLCTSFSLNYFSVSSSQRLFSDPSLVVFVSPFQGPPSPVLRVSTIRGWSYTSEMMSFTSHHFKNIVILGITNPGTPSPLPPKKEVNYRVQIKRQNFSLCILIIKVFTPLGSTCEVPVQIFFRR